MNSHASPAAVQADRAVHSGDLCVAGKILQANWAILGVGREFTVHVVERDGTVHRVHVDGRGFRRANEQIDCPFLIIPRTARRHLTIFDGHLDLR